MRDCLQQDAHVQPYRPVLDVVDIQQAQFVERQVRAAAHLPQSRHAPDHRQPLMMPRFVVDDFFRQWRSRPHQAHLAYQDIIQLRQFVETEAANQAAGARLARIVLDLE